MFYKIKTFTNEELEIIKNTTTFQDDMTKQIRQNILDHEKLFPNMEFDKIEYGYDVESFSYKVNILFKPKL